jgi:hypothetical protein
MNLIQDFEDTLSRLIENQETLNVIQNNDELFIERDALIKTQESLKAHIHFLSDIYPKERKVIKGLYVKEQNLIQKFSYLKKICDIQIQIPFQSNFHLRKSRFKKIHTI